MKKYSLSFLLGNLLLHQLSDINNLFTGPLIFFAFFIIAWSLIFFFVTEKYKQIFIQSGSVLLFFSVGYLVTWLSANAILNKSLPDSLEKKEIVVRGHIDAVPVIDESSYKFNFLITEGPQESPNQLSGTRIRLSWYFQSAKSIILPKVGEYWQFKVKLKHPSGLFNPGGFDYERWLFQQHIRATGYVRNSNKNTRLNESINWNYVIDNRRQTFSYELDNILQDNQFKGLLKALILGIRDDIEPSTWRVFIDTGTNHIMAISGLHIGLLAAIGFFIGRYFWSIVPTFSNLIPAQLFGAICAIFFALGYAALAGFSIPTQRALIMVVAAFSSWFIRKRIPVEVILSWTLILVLIYDPMSSLSLGFWLSFAAVTIILWFANNFLIQQKQNEHYQEKYSLWKAIKIRVLQYGTIPIVLFLGLLPLSILFFERLSLLSPIANFFAVPWMSMLIIPLSLLAAFISVFNSRLAEVLFNSIESLMTPLYEFLKILAEYEINLLYISSSSIIVIMLAYCGGYIVFRGDGTTKKIFGGLFIIPLFLPSSNSIPAGHFQLSALDVGQGLSLIIQTENHLLIYDTGNAVSERFNMADVALLPYLRHFNLNVINTLVLSHADNDHIGAAPYLLRAYVPHDIISGEVKRLKSKSDIDSKPCMTGQSWEWDGVVFKVISPQKAGSKVAKGKSNNRSCVIWIQAENGYSALLTGDAEIAIESQLIKNNQIKNSNLLIAGHHGSSTSSSQHFIEWVNPEAVIFTFGYKNRYNFPSSDVVQRFKQQNTLIYATVNGTIDISSDISNNAAQIREYRKLHRRYWNRAYISYNK